MTVQPFRPAPVLGPGVTLRSAPPSAGPPPPPPGAGNPSSPVPPELRLDPPAPPEARPEGWRRAGLYAALGLSLVGVAAPLVHQAMQHASNSKEAQTLQDHADVPRRHPDLPAAHNPAPEVPVGRGAVLLSPDGRHLLLESTERGFGPTVVRAADGRTAVRLEGNQRLGTFLADSRLVTWSEDAGGVLELREAATGRVLSTLPAPGVRELSVAPSGAGLAWSESSNRDGALHVVQVREGHLHQTTVLPGRGGRLSWAPDGTRLAAVQEGYYGSPSRVTVVDTRDGRVAFDQEVSSKVRSVSLSRDGSLLAMAGGSYDDPWSGRVSIVDLRDGKDLWSRRGFGAAAFSPEGDRLVLGRNGSPFTLEMVEARTGRGLWTAYAPGGQEIRFSPDGKTVAAASGSTLAVFDTAGGSRLWARQQSGNPPSFVFSPDGSRVAVTEWIKAGNQEGQSVLSLLDAADGRVVAQHAGPGRFVPPAFSQDGRYLLAQAEQGYGSSKVHVLDVARSPVTRDEAAEARARVAGLLDRMMEGSPLADPLRQKVHERLDGLPPNVVQALADRGTRLVVRTGGGSPASLAGEVDVPGRFSDPAQLRSLADRAFAQADARYGKRIADLEARLASARNEARRNPGRTAGLGGLVAMESDPSWLDEGVQRLASDLWQARQERDLEAWSLLEAASAGRLEPVAAVRGQYDPRAATATAAQPVTLESLARAHGASTPEDARRFMDLVQALNGGRLEQAQKRYLEMARRVYPEAAELPVARRPFLAAGADLVVPSYHHDGGRVLSGRDMGALAAWRTGAASAVVQGPDGRSVIVLHERALGEDLTLEGEVREAVGRAFDRALQEGDPAFYQGFGPRWREAWWHSRWYRSGDVGSSATPADLFAKTFAEHTGSGPLLPESRDSQIGRLMQIAVEASGRERPAAR